MRAPRTWGAKIDILPEQRRKMYRLHREGLSDRALAERFQCAPLTVRDNLKIAAEEARQERAAG